MVNPYRRYTTVNGVEILIAENWYLNGEYHRVDGPASLEWEVLDGVSVLTNEDWYLNGQRHCVDGPAWRQRMVIDNEVIILEVWYYKDLLHRTDGPAWEIWKVIEGQRVSAYKSWHLRGNKIEARVLRQPVRVIERWWRAQQKRRQAGIEDSLWKSGMIVFPGLMKLLGSF